MIGSNVSHYSILEKLGEGRMSVVFKALDTRLKRPVALKFLPAELTIYAEAKERFVQEAQAASALDHPNICTIYEIDETENGQMFICMAYYEGETLKARIERGPQKLNEAVSISIQVAQGLVKAHGQGIVHRDIKPANILITEERQVKILDFGLAKLAGQTGITRAGTIMGTVAYMSPEQAQGKEVDHRTDIWSLGCVLYEMVTGELPFRGENEQAMVYSVLNEDQQPVTSLRSKIPMGLERIVHKVLKKSPEERYQHADELLIDLRAIQKELEGGSSKKPSAAPKREPSIAVLPFRDLSAQKDQEYFCEGMAEELINGLVKVEGLRVAARTSAFQFKGKDQDIRKIGEQLNVDTVLEGSVRKAGNQLRITAELINVSDGYLMWSEKFDRSMEDIFAIQEEIALAIVNNLKGRLLGEEKSRLVKRHTENLEAYHLYLKGRFFWNRQNEGALKKSIDYFQEAIGLDPDYALPYVGIADAFNLLGYFGYLTPRESFPTVKAAVKRALEIDGSLGEAHASQGWVSTFYDWNWPDAEREFKRAVALSPNHAGAHEWYALFLGAMGRFEEAIGEAKRAQELDPLSLAINAVLGLVLYFAEKFDESIEQHRKALEMDPGFLLGHLWLGLACVEKARYTEALATFQKAEIFAGENTYALGILGWGYGRSGKKEEASRVLERLDRLSRERYVSSFQRALPYIGLGLDDQAFEQLEKALLSRDPLMVFFKWIPLAKNLRSLPRFSALVKEMGL